MVARPTEDSLSNPHKHNRSKGAGQKLASLPVLMSLVEVIQNQQSASYDPLNRIRAKLSVRFQKVHQMMQRRYRDTSLNFQVTLHQPFGQRYVGKIGRESALVLPNAAAGATVQQVVQPKADNCDTNPGDSEHCNADRSDRTACRYLYIDENAGLRILRRCGQGSENWLEDFPTGQRIRRYE